MRQDEYFMLVNQINALSLDFGTVAKTADGRWHVVGRRWNIERPRIGISSKLTMWRDEVEVIEGVVIDNSY